MSQSESQPHGVPGALPATAPLVRLTAGVGSAGQKTWNVRRPVTLLGSRRPAHIALHDRDVSKAHCVIVNTGADVLLKDLHTNTGTFCNNKRVDGIAVLKDGDIISVGATKLQIAIQVPEDQADDSACGVEFVEPGKFREPVHVRLDHTDTQWRIEDAVVLIGRHDSAAIRLDHEDVSTRHAILFRFVSGPAIFDVGSRNGVWVNGERCALSALRSVERITVGPCTLTVTSSERDAAPLRRPDSTADDKPETPSTGVTGRSGAGPGGDETSPPSAGRRGEVSGATPASALSRGSSSAAVDSRSPTEALADIESELGTLQRNIADSWDRLNAWQSRLLEDATKLTRKESDLVAREEELDAKDAALRGQLHDLTRYHEQITARERELAAQLARIQARQEELDAGEAAFADNNAEVAQRAEDLKRREHVLAQRWTRLTAATCSHCSRPVNIRTPGATDTQP